MTPLKKGVGEEKGVVYPKEGSSKHKKTNVLGCGILNNPGICTLRYRKPRRKGKADAWL